MELYYPSHIVNIIYLQALTFNKQARVTFETACEDYVIIRESIHLAPTKDQRKRLEVLEGYYKKLPEYYLRVGADKMQELKWDKRKINSEWIKRSGKGKEDMITDMLESKLKERGINWGDKISLKETKEVVKEVYEVLNPEKAATAREIKHYIEVKPGEMMIEGKRVPCYKIVGRKIIID